MATVREPTVEDAPALGVVHVRAWQRAYRGGLMPDEYLDSLSLDDRAQWWAEGLQRPPRPRCARFVAQDDAGAVVGFIVVGPMIDEPDGDTGEVYALNVHPDVWGAGYGRVLLQAGIDALSGAGFTQAILWVHPANTRARRFYEAAGWRAEELERQAEILGVEVPEVRYRRPL